MEKDGKIKFTESELKRMSGAPTKVYLRKTMTKLFRNRWEEHLTKLLSGDRETLDLCAQHLKGNLDFFPLLHTLCLVTGQQFDLKDKNHVRAADSWMCWFDENKERLAWNLELEHWEVKP